MVLPAALTLDDTLNKSGEGVAIQAVEGGGLRGGRPGVGDVIEGVPARRGGGRGAGDGVARSGASFNGASGDQLADPPETFNPGADLLQLIDEIREEPQEARGAAE
ncbi:hypothetical protein [Roseomonas indoligenes]|uniref:hypothetical protein n=1 Tax=Roseomonas indoligenes TaxID=2820811 RepID=UPI001FD82327|nr:hypothetical protein [Pararoseomonas indoligenes]